MEPSSPPLPPRGQNQDLPLMWSTSNTQAHRLAVHLAPQPRPCSTGSRMDRAASRPFRGTPLGTWLDPKRATGPPADGPTTPRPWLLEFPRTPATTAMARTLSDFGRHPVLLRPALPSLDFRALHPHLLRGHPSAKGNHHRHGSRPPDQSPRPNMSSRQSTWWCSSGRFGRLGQTHESDMGLKTSLEVLRNTSTSTSPRSTSTKTHELLRLLETNLI